MPKTPNQEKQLKFKWRYYSRTGRLVEGSINSEREARFELAPTRSLTFSHCVSCGSRIIDHHWREKWSGIQRLCLTCAEKGEIDVGTEGTSDRTTDLD